MDSKNQQLILIINPGSTSTKLALYNGNKNLFKQVVHHSSEVLSRYPSVLAQYDYRRRVILDFLKEEANIKLDELSCIVSRGGLTKPLKSGVYYINEAMLVDLKRAPLGEHVSNVGPLIAHSLASPLKIPSFVVDPVVVDEMDDIARLTGIKSIKRKSIFHALNHKFSAKLVAQSLGKSYKECNFIVVHMGGGVTIGSHLKGRVVDVNNALDGEGPWGAERSGTVPFGEMIDFCMQNHNLSRNDMRRYFIGQGGLVSYFGTSSAEEISKTIHSEEDQLVIRAMAYNVAKSILSALVPLKGDCDAIILTGGLSYWKYFVNLIKNYIAWLKIPIKYFPGDNELKALAEGALKALNNEIEVLEYK